MKTKVKSLWSYLDIDIWACRLDTLPRWKSMIVKVLRVLVLSIKDFFHDQCYLRAAAITFYSVLSVVPVVAMLFALAKGFGFEKTLRSYMLDKFADQQEVINKVFEFAEKMLQNTKGGVIAGIGVILLVWAVVKLIGNIETSFNHIWRVERGRPFVRKLGDYILLVLMTFFTMILSSSATVFLITQINQIVGRIEFLQSVSTTFVFVLIKLLPYVLVWIFFTILYVFMPNTKVSVFSAFVAALIAGTIFQLIQEFYIVFQVALSKYNAIYGSFSALPLFLIWMQVTWLIVLFGAEIAFAHQNSENFELEVFTDKVSHNAFKAYSLKTAVLLVQNFFSGGAPMKVGEISRACRMSIGLTRKVLYCLMDTSVVIECLDKDKNSSNIVYQPVCNAGELTINEVMIRIDNLGMDKIDKNDKYFEKMAAIIRKMDEDNSKSAENVTLKSLKFPEA